MALITLSPVAEPNSVRVLLSLAATFDWSLGQLDVKNTFLNGDLMKEYIWKPLQDTERSLAQKCASW